MKKPSIRYTGNRDAIINVKSLCYWKTIYCYLGYAMAMRLKEEIFVLLWLFYVCIKAWLKLFFAQERSKDISLLSSNSMCLFVIHVWFFSMFSFRYVSLVSTFLPEHMSIFSFPVKKLQQEEPRWVRSAGSRAGWRDSQGKHSVA